MYTSLKTLHALTALVTIAGFLLRGYWMLTGNALLNAKLTRILPHVVDTLFLVSGVALLVLLDGGPLTQAWMLTKIGGLVAYIALGMLALRRGRTEGIRNAAFVAAVAVFAYTYGIALSKSPLSWLAVFAG